MSLSVESTAPSIRHHPRDLVAQRWVDRREIRLACRARAEADGFRPADFAVDVVPERQGRSFVERHHYSGTYPAARLAVGLFRERATGAELAGVAVFSVPMNQRSVVKHAGVEDPGQGVELGRFVLTDSVGFTAESWFLSRALGALAREKPEIRAVVSYSDPVERVDAAGRVCKPGHIGTIYQSTNAFFIGRATPRTLVVASSGQVISARALSKVRAGERGAAYAERQLVAAGCPQRGAGEDPASWLTRVLAGLGRVRHPGNLTYVFGVGRGETRRLAALHPRLPYPKAEAIVHAPGLKAA